MGKIGVDQREHGGRHRVGQREIHLDEAEYGGEKVDGDGRGGGRLT